MNYKPCLTKTYTRPLGSYNSHQVEGMNLLICCTDRAGLSLAGWQFSILTAPWARHQQQQILRFLQSLIVTVLEIPDNINKQVKRTVLLCISVLAESSNGRRKLYPTHGKGLLVHPVSADLISHRGEKNWRLHSNRCTKQCEEGFTNPSFVILPFTVHIQKWMKGTSLIIFMLVGQLFLWLDVAFVFFYISFFNKSEKIKSI